MRYKLISGFLAAAIVHAIAVPIVWAASELIAPTRSLDGADEMPTVISIFSEPPGLEVFLDGINIGVAPVIQQEVMPGSHIVRISDTEQAFQAPAGRSLKISYFKGSFIEIPDKQTSDDPEPPNQKTTSKTPRKQAQSESKTIETNYFYWPLNPKGPIH